MTVKAGRYRHYKGNEFVGWNGQQWTTLDDLRDSHRIVVTREEAGLYGIGMELSFAIGQRALLVTHPKGNFLWDCVPLIDDGLVQRVKGIGGISAIAISHSAFNVPTTMLGTTGSCKKTPPSSKKSSAERGDSTYAHRQTPPASAPNTLKTLSILPLVPMAHSGLSIPALSAIACACCLKSRPASRTAEKKELGRFHNRRPMYCCSVLSAR